MTALVKLVGSRKAMAPPPVLLPGKSHGRRSLVGLQSMASLKVGHDWTASLSLFTFMHWRRKWQPTPAKGTFHAEMGTIKDRNDMDLTEAEDIKKRWQEYTEELYRKDLHDPVNHDGVTTHLEPDILECEVKWALGSITMNKASRGGGIPVWAWVAHIPCFILEIKQFLL